MGVVEQDNLALDARGVTKRFGSNLALDGVDVQIKPGRIRALLGMNGSGKSTFVKVLSGFHPADSGTIAVGGKPLRDGAIAFVHQDLGLVDELSVLHNLGLGSTPPMKRGVIDNAAERAAGREMLSSFGLEHLAERPVGELRMAEKTVVAIARALEQTRGGGRLLVLDEPTSSLATSETAQLLEVMRDCAARGLGMLFISHRLAEVMAVADDVTVLRGGRIVLQSAVSDTSIDAIVAAMTGREGQSLEELAEVTASDAKRSESVPSPVVLDVSGLAGSVLDGVDLCVRRGEILGITGLLGSGVEEIGGLLSGRTVPIAGEIRYQGSRLSRKIARSIGYITANRVHSAVLTGLSTRENASFTTLKSYLRGAVLSVARERAAMKRWFEDLAVHPLDTEIGMLQLSGGNQQKVLFARWLATSPDLLVAEEPAQGIDIHAKAQLLAKLREFAEQGLAVVLISGEPEEIYAACDRMVVLSGGRVADEFHAPLSVTPILSAIHAEVSHD